MAAMDDGDGTFAAEIVEADAARGIAKAVGARHSIARRYVMRVRRRNPDATPAEVIGLLERHYVTAISAAGAVVTAGTIAADIGIAMIPVAGAAAAGAKHAGRQALKRAGKEVAVGAARKARALLPAGDQQLQFELTAIFGLAVADIHGWELDRDQAHALVLGLSNERVSQQQIAAMAKDVATVAADGALGAGPAIAAGRDDWSHWAGTLATMLPAGAAQSLVGTIETGRLDAVRQSLSGRQQAAVEYGVGALTGGVTRFLFGREVVEAAREAFPAAPERFPAHLAATVKARTGDDAEAEPNRALAALEDAAKATGTWISGAASTAGAGVASAAGAVTRPFRRVDRDGDGVADAPPALTAVKGVAGKAASLFRSRKSPDAAG
ncbi:hypothetical protein [Dactylosporangium matsuzakiense]|uniref:Uncharacterized protein n=1 Tax=Dactylosporangium matsuzakiense TaxID=53360 RepID=A0A9W6KL68_9ACTN|nr:hypothetical protein [Dactylosporangium matsuzakiense]UWZ48270.1 hypothetical protein Dmats_18800 [Dactylosporangium matsuzakiense]GLL01509.1 hypothetical protein GCM10017581_032500 [Dactylosporangium matsuzakiense]